MKKKLLVALATLITITGSVAMKPAVAEAGLFYCSTTAPTFHSRRTICEGVEAGGNQHQRAWITCLYYTFQWRTYYGPTVGVLQYSTAYAPTDGRNCYGGVQLRP